jgi:dTDP-4-amino-4,6-dideoxygalactose transaminase
MKRIKICETRLSEASRKYVNEVFDSGWLETGPQTQKFEEEFKEKYEAPNALLLTSCTAALHLACKLIGKSGFDVITTPLTFMATNLAISMANMFPKFVDIDPTTGNISPKAIKDAITPFTAAIMVVHYGGLPADMFEIMEIADDNGIPIIQDAAHAMGASYDGMPIGSFGDYVCFSMNAKKNCGVGDGGVLVCKDKDYEEAKRLRWFGLNKTTYGSQRGVNDKWWEFEVPTLGYKYNPTDIMAALARGELENLSGYNKHRNRLMRVYRERLSTVDGITLLRNPWPCVNAGYLMTVKAQDRDKLVEKLTRHNIECNVYYMPNNCFKAFGDGSEDICRKQTPEAWRFYQEALSLPLHVGLTDDDVERVCCVIERGW